MKTKNLIINILLSGLLATTIFSTQVKAAPLDSVNSMSVRKKFSELGKPRALDTYWEFMAQCETGSNWQNSGKYSGGLGIYIQTWIGFGGRQFAPTPHEATKEEQIIVANRISTQGYQTKNTFLTLDDRLNDRPFFRPPSGFSGWGCAKHIARPTLHTKPPYKIYFWKFPIGERSERVRTLQQLIGIKNPTGRYSEWVKKRHLAFVKKHRATIEKEYLRYKNSVS